MTIALVTVTYNAGPVWAPFIACLSGQEGADWHLYVIDNASTDGTADTLAATTDPRVTVIQNADNLGVAAANNQGIVRAMQAGAELIVLINNDTEFGPDMLARLKAELDRSNADAISPLIPFFDHPGLIWYGGGSFVRWKGIENTHDHDREPLAVVGNRPFVTDYAPTCCVMFRRDVFDRIGLMDERYFVYWDDTDFMWRMKLAGMKLVLDPTTQLLHKVSSSTGGRLSDFTIRYQFRNQMLFTRKFHGVLWTAYTAFAAAAMGIVFMITKGDTPHHFKRRIAALGEGLALPRP